MGIVNVAAKRRAAGRKASGVRGECAICHRKVVNALVVKGKAYTDQYGVRRKSADVVYHRECYSMQNRGLLRSGYDIPARSSVGKPCAGCDSVIEPGDKHAHRQGQPFHKECL